MIVNVIKKGFPRYFSFQLDLNYTTFKNVLTIDYAFDYVKGKHYVMNVISIGGYFCFSHWKQEILFNSALISSSNATAVAPKDKAYLGPEQFSTWNDHFFVPNDRIFHCLNTQNSPNISICYICQNIFRIFRRPPFPPLGGAIIKECAFCPRTHRYFVTHSKTLYPRVH